MGKLERVWLHCCVTFPVFADLHYVFSGDFRREHRAVLAGKLEFLKAQKRDSQSNIYTLRRNLHRLEKGLIMRPRRPIFAADYIAETIDCYLVVKHRELDCANANAGSPCLAGAVERDQTNVTLLEWADSVLTRYFSSVDCSAPAIEKAYTRFQQVAPLQAEAGSYAPYLPRSLDHSISSDQLFRLCLQRRSVRWYEPRPVPRNLLEEAIKIATLAPSACNRQPFRFFIADQPELAQSLGRIPMGTVGFSDQFPCFVVVIGDLSAYFSERDRHLIYIDAGLASMSFLLALETLGLSSCCINWPDIEEREIQLAEQLQLALHERAVMCISIGFRKDDGEIPFSQKKSIAELSKYVEKNVCG